MKKSMLKNIFIAGSVTLALSASTIALPSVADAKGVGRAMRAMAALAAISAATEGPAGLAATMAATMAATTGGFCGPIQSTLGLLRSLGRLKVARSPLSILRVRSAFDRAPWRGRDRAAGFMASLDPPVDREIGVKRGGTADWSPANSPSTLTGPNPTTMQRFNQKVRS